MDTYLLVAMLLEQICGKHIIIKQKLLIFELHTSIKHLYSNKLLPHLQSCLDELLWTSIIRFEQMGCVEINAYSNKQGSKTNFIICHGESHEKINSTLDFLKTHRSFEQDTEREIYEEVANAIMRAQGPVPIAKL